VKDRRQLPWFLAAYVAFSGLLLVAVDALSQGRFLENLTTFIFAGVSMPTRVFTWLPVLLLRTALPVIVLGPLALLSFVLDRRRLTIYHVGLVFASIVLAYVITDLGASFNHFIDIEVLLVVVVGTLWTSLPRLSGNKAHIMRSGLVVSVIVMLAAGSIKYLLPADIRTVSDLASGESRRYSVWPLDDLVLRGDSVLSEDPYIPVALGCPPTILDPFMLLRLLDTHPDWRKELVRRLERREFDEVILLQRADPRDAWYQLLNLGSPVVRAVRQNYTLEAIVSRGWELFTPPVIDPDYAISSRPIAAGSPSPRWSAATSAVSWCVTSPTPRDLLAPDATAITWGTLLVVAHGTACATWITPITLCWPSCRHSRRRLPPRPDLTSPPSLISSRAERRDACGAYDAAIIPRG
jgi:hypothetical protein